MLNLVQCKRFYSYIVENLFRIFRTKTTLEKMLDFPASLGRRPVTFAQLKRHTNMYRKLKPCCKLFLFSRNNLINIFNIVDASLQFFEERTSRRQRQQVVDYGNNQPVQL